MKEWWELGRHLVLGTVYEGIVSGTQNCPELLVGGHLDLTSVPVPLSPQHTPTPLFGVSSFRQQQKPKGLSQLLGGRTL